MRDFNLKSAAHNMKRETQTMLSKSDVAEMFSCSPQTVARWIKSGQLRSIRVRGMLRVLPEDVDQFIQTNASKRESA
jgi:excisionase family DNA binding protein